MYLWSKNGTWSWCVCFNESPVPFFCFGGIGSVRVKAQSRIWADVPAELTQPEAGSLSWNLGQIPQAPLLQLFTGANPPVSKAGLLISLEHCAEVDRKSPINYLGCSFFTGNCVREHPVLAEGFDAWCQFCSDPSQSEGSSCGTKSWRSLLLLCLSGAKSASARARAAACPFCHWCSSSDTSETSKTCTYFVQFGTCQD